MCNTGILPSMDNEHSVVIYDGECGFCTWCVLFILHRDQGDQYRFAALKSKTAQSFFLKEGITDTEVLWLIDTKEYYRESSAVLRAVGRLGGIYQLSYAGLLMPRFIRDWVYTKVSLVRKRLVKGNVCPIIPWKYEHLFIE